MSANEVLGDAATIEVIEQGSDLILIGAFAAKRKPRAEVQIVVDLVGAGILTPEEALLRVNPNSLTEHLHPQIEPGGTAEVIARGIGGSPGAAQGKIVFSAEAAQAAHAQGQPAILVRKETSPEDIRGMHSAAGVLTSSGGTSSHAAVIAQGIGVPCVVGASELRIDAARKTLTLAGGATLNEGEQITIDGADGRVMDGALTLSHSPLSEAFKTLMQWADATRNIGVRANADTLYEAQTAKRFQVDGIGLCRTEHMFYDNDRINVMREMILAEDAAHRTAALDQLLPMQRANFVELFELMEGAPVTIRLLDPPLHEFLPKGQSEIATLATQMGLKAETLYSRIASLEEYNPMLGMRGVRLAVTMPEIYEMQARAIFEAAAIASQSSANPVTPEIMIPLVSAHKEVELVKSRIETVAKDVARETGTQPQFHLGVMVETPRAALRAGDLAEINSFLSFGTNDLTQMTYGLSRDDAGRFMREYVNNGVYPEDPFLTLDVEGVGELLLTAARRGRRANPDITLGLCGEHGGDPASVQFCKIAGFDYVSCSPFRVPIARLAAAQASLLSENNEK
jgi:pyruvate,orthophosphate dikinase